MDLLEEQELRGEINRAAVYSNIPGDRERQRSLFQAAEKCERKPRKNHLVTSTAYLEDWEFLARMDYARGWATPMVTRLRREREKLEAKAAKAGSRSGTRR